MRGCCGFSSAQTVSVLRHLLAIGHATIEDRTTIECALSYCEAGIDLADAVHYASYRACVSMASFDNQKSRHVPSSWAGAGGLDSGVGAECMG